MTHYEGKSTMLQENLLLVSLKYVVGILHLKISCITPIIAVYNETRVLPNGLLIYRYSDCNIDILS